MTERLVSVVLPVHNQADHIAEIVRGYETVLDRLPHAHETILVMNGCRDDSLEICQTLRESCPSTRTISLAGGGWGLAVKAGIRESHGDLICYTNSARTTPEDLTLMLLYALAYPDVVVKANRKVRERWQRRLGSLLYNLECRALFDLSQWDINGTPKVFPRAFHALLALRRDDDLIDLEFNSICRREEYRVIEVPIFSSRRFGGKSTTSYWSAVRMYTGAYMFWKERRENSYRAPFV